MELGVEVYELIAMILTCFSMAFSVVLGASIALGVCYYTNKVLKALFSSFVGIGLFISILLIGAAVIL